MARWIWVVVATLVACGTPDTTDTTPLGELIGRIEIEQDVPQPGCRVKVPGTARAVDCDQRGQFAIRLLRPGTIEIEIVADQASSVIPARRLTTAANAGFITDLGAIRIARPGKVGGHVTVPPGQTLPYSIITIPGFAVASSPDPSNRGYVMDRVPAGVHDVVLWTEAGAVVNKDVQVRPDETTLSVNFDLAAIESHEVNVIGTAAVEGSTERAGIEIELVEMVAGAVKTTTTTDGEGAFAMPARSGVYLVRARRASRSASLPSVVVYGARDIVLSTTLVIPAAGDLDGDGIPDAEDDDADGDGVSNADDAFPFDANESSDLDGDGVGDNVDLDRNGDGGIDGAIPTPDADGDGFLDFEDNCVVRANADQADTDGDRVGNLCDNCPGVSNRSQLDSDGNGTGDACESCIAGAPCTPANACNVGTLTCTQAGPICSDTSLPQPDGVGCGMDLVCFAGTCGPCMNGGSCFTSSGGACNVGVQSCATGMATCLPTAIKRADGTPCGLDQVCDDGACAACTEGGACTYAPNECHVGRLSCDTGLPQICEDSMVDAPDGTPCQGSRFCRSGVCETCNQGAACSPVAAPCHLGTYTCGTGTAVCTDLGFNAPDGSPCVGAGMFCSSGACITSPNTLTLISGGAQTANAGAILAPVVIRLADGGNNPLVGEAITISAPPGASVAVAPGNTDSNGRTSFSLRLGPQAGPQTFLVLSGAAPALSIVMTATAVPAGRIHTIVNADHVNDYLNIPGPAALARIGRAIQVVVGADGTVYLASGGFFSTVLAIDPQGTIREIAGGGANGAPTWGDGGLALDAQVSATNLVLDAAANALYISDNYSLRVRRVDLATGLISTVAGGGVASPPGHGDGGPATGAYLWPAGIALGPDGALYIADTYASRIRRVDPSGTITSVLAAAQCAPGDAIGITSLSGAIAFDQAGSLFIAGPPCGTSAGGYSSGGIVRRATDGSVHHVAGHGQGTTGNGAAARNSAVTVDAITFDPAGNLLFSDSATSRIRRIDGNTGIVTTVAGTGTAGSAAEFAVAATSPLNTPAGLAFAGSDLLVAEQYNYSVRRISGVASARTPITMSATTVATSAPINGLVPALSARLSNGGTNYAGMRVEWASLDAGAHIYTPWTATNVAGVGATAVRPGRAAGSYRFEARFVDPHGVDVMGSPITYTVTATAPATGSIFTVANVAATAGAVGVPGPASVAQVGYLNGIVTRSDGTIYVADRYEVLAISPAGMMTSIAGGGSSRGDNGPATAAQFVHIDALALDETNGILYVADTTDLRVRAIDLGSGIIWTVAGGGSTAQPAPYGDGGPATAAYLLPYDIALGPDNALYVVDGVSGRIRRVSLMSPNLITNFMAGGGACTAAVALATCSADCRLAWVGTDLYVLATLCGTSPGGYVKGIVRRNPDTSLTHLAGGSAALLGEGVAATSAQLSASNDLAPSGAGTIYYTDGNRIRRISAGTVTTIAGSTTYGHAGDYGPATAALLYTPTRITLDPAGRVLVSDGYNYCVRQVW